METDKEQLEAYFDTLAHSCAGLHQRLSVVFKPNELELFRDSVNSLLQETRSLINKIEEAKQLHF